ncbi:MAG: hypothetical protein QOH97_3504 [Actinoplanes sp.]|jgi:hypothetical protein|nr:hypothetical protein [Actinoplanes sp.]
MPHGVVVADDRHLEALREPVAAGPEFSRPPCEDQPDQVPAYDLRHNAPS